MSWRITQGGRTLTQGYLVFHFLTEMPPLRRWGILPDAGEFQPRRTSVPLVVAVFPLRRSSSRLIVAVFQPRRSSYPLVGALPILWESVATLINPENPIILEILIQTITKIPKRVKTSAEYEVKQVLRQQYRGEFYPKRARSNPHPETVVENRAAQPALKPFRVGAYLNYKQSQSSHRV